MATLFKREFGRAPKAPGWLLNTFMRLAGSLNESSEINLKKYAWQFGTTNFKSAVEAVFAQAKVVDYARIHAPSLFLMSEVEAPELKRRSLEIYRNFC